MFTKSAKMVVSSIYEELLDLLDGKYHTNLCRICGAHNHKSTFKIKTNNYVADPPHEPWGIDEIHVNISNGSCSRCQEKGVIKDIWNVKKTQTYKLQKLEGMWIDNINPTAITSEVITHNGRSLKLAKTEYEKNFRTKIELKPIAHRPNLTKLETTTPLKSPGKSLLEAMESDSENENETETPSKKIDPRLVKIADMDVVSPGASNSTGLSLSSPLASPRKARDERKIVWLGSTKVHNIKNISDPVKEVEEEASESAKKVSVVEVKKENLRKIYGLKKIRS